MRVGLINGFVWLNGDLKSKSLLIDNGKITELVDPGKGTAAPVDQEFDLKGKWILPGGIDFHVHISEGAETFYPGSCCAASGGITTVMDMPPFHECITVNQLREKGARVEANSVIDVGLIAGIVIEENDLVHMEELKSYGACYFKVFQPADPPVSNATLWKAVQVAAHTGLRLALHAEDPSFSTEDLPGTDPLIFPRSRPAVAETSVVAQVIEMARFAGAPLHICHVSSGRSAELVAWAKSHGVDVTCETPPHFLMLEESAFEKYGARVKTTPPLRKSQDVQALWQAINEGVIDLIACDHYTENLQPTPFDAKLIHSAAAGIAGLEVSLPLIMDAVLNDRISLKAFTELTAVNPSRLAGIAHQKGSIAVGIDADLAIWDPKSEWTIAREQQFSRINTTPYEGWQLKGRLVQTWSRGKMVWDGEEILLDAGSGRWIRSRHT